MRISTLLVVLVTTLIALPAYSADWEGPLLIWTYDRKKTVKARFIKLADDNLDLQLESGRQTSVKLNRLSPESQQQASEQQENWGYRRIDALRKMSFVKIQHGRFTMGSPLKEPGRLANVQAKDAGPVDPTRDPAADVEPEHQVAISRDFWLKQTEVTYAEWEAVLEFAEGRPFSDISKGLNGCGKDALKSHPVTNITWWDAIKWCNLKSKLENKGVAYYITREFNPDDLLTSGMPPVVYVKWDATGYRLPTEAEWEFACRGNRSDNNRAFYSGQVGPTWVEPLDPALAKIAWYGGNSGGTTHPVKTRKENGYGLFDMHGNVAEWCWDWNELLSPKDAKDPRGAEKGMFRVFRGGSWADPPISCRAAYRGNFSPSEPSGDFIGFRPVCGSDPAVPDKDSPTSTKRRRK